MVDSILKNVRGVYIKLFSHNVVKTFCDAFTQVDSPVRKQLLVLFETWITGHIFPEPILSEIQSNIKKIEMEKAQNQVHVNPAFLKTPNPSSRASPQPHPAPKVTEPPKLQPTNHQPVNPGLLLPHQPTLIPTSMQGVSPLHQPVVQAAGLGVLPSAVLPGLSPSVLSPGIPTGISPSFFPGGSTMVQVWKPSQLDSIVI